MAKKSRASSKKSKAAPRTRDGFLKAASLDLPDDFQLDEDFQSCFHALEKTRDHLYITGEAGTGKTTLLKYFRRNTQKNVVILAPTGIAAINCYGQTLHSFFKFPPKLVQKEHVRRIYNAQKIFSRLDMLIIDEASMMRADLLDAVDESMRLNMHNYDEPFGGVQVVLFGDLYQLPPIVDRQAQEIYGARYATPYFFSSKVFSQTPFRRLALKKIYRQNDSGFAEILNRIRNKTLSDADLALLNTRASRQALDNAEDCITLTPTNAAAAVINEFRLSRLSSEEFSYSASVQGEFDEPSYPTDAKLRLKAGAQVLMIQNDPEKRWVNGSVGEVVQLKESSIEVLIDGKIHKVEKTKWKKIRYEHDAELDQITEEEIGGFEQYPIKLAWAITIHKSQGLTFDRVTVDLGSGTFTHGQAYVALSRCRSLEGLTLKRPLTRRDIIFDPRIAKYHEPPESAETVKEETVVVFEA